MLKQLVTRAGNGSRARKQVAVSEGPDWEAEQVQEVSQDQQQLGKIVHLPIPYNGEQGWASLSQHLVCSWTGERSRSGEMLTWFTLFQNQGLQDKNTKDLPL